MTEADTKKEPHYDLIEQMDTLLRLLQNNIHVIALDAHEKWINPTTRPKKDRIKYSAKQYESLILKRIKFYQNAFLTVPPWMINAIFNRWVPLHGLILSAIGHQGDAWRQILSILSTELPIESPSERNARKDEMRKLRAEQENMADLDPNRKCLKCMKFMFERDSQNNYRHKKAEVCTCSESKPLQKRMKEKISEYRKKKKADRKQEKERKAKKRRLHGTT